jgi:hypothetical protein
VLAYLARYTHRVAISNRRLITFNKDGVTFRYKDYRADGRARYKRMTLAPGEFIRRFLIHVLPKGFHRIRHVQLKILAFSQNYGANPRLSLETAACFGCSLGFRRFPPKPLLMRQTMRQLNGRRAALRGGRPE